ncbi:hypothetical protein BO70DRAFT_425585 [Aspergillus heteromorphus CBS 117.55]|uniref:Uncharacterized protein n=1 Tax=Aspergillus heteromorphus CBS 117.55 TaxID=1448321 RepID=A0A317X2T2_9EURO|nr:uncharacterized protein BO70DRAFT_425585 [Aspergillus heteromorphus CBS 117.55]PWY92944.1 hypothetical protein BO70DRAFT_425585 [Aspergillus heteromorphus CBS 117.55]
MANSTMDHGSPPPASSGRRGSSSSRTPLQSPPSLLGSSSSNSSDKRRRDVEPSVPRRLYVTSDSPDFDAGILARLHAEGFDVEYLAFPGDDRKELENLLHEREDNLEPGERYAVVAYNKPAHLLLESHHQPSTTTNPFPRLCALIAYYPDCCSTTTTTTTTPTTYPSSVPLLPIQIHLAGTATHPVPSSSSSSSSSSAIHPENVTAATSSPTRNPGPARVRLACDARLARV